MKSSDIFPEYVTGHPKGERQRRSSKRQTNQENPKPRPPDSIRDKIPFYGRLPKYSGPYQVGIIDLEIPAREPRQFSKIKRDHRHTFVLETVLVSIYYPAHLDSASEERIQKARSKHNARPTWLARPRHLTVEGYAKFASLPQWPILAFFMMTTYLTKLPAYRNARIAEHWPEINEEWHNRKTNSTAGPVPALGPLQPKFPLILFSHGLGGTKTSYSSVCGEFASHGFIVCAIEHRDGSGPRSLVNYNPHDSPRRGESEAAMHAKHNRPPKAERSYGMVDFIMSEKDKYDTSPDHELDHELREAQIALRVAEVDEAYHLMTKIHAGRGNELKEQNLRKAGMPGASSLELDGVDFRTWVGRFHVDNVSMIGHSFGSTTTIEMLRSSTRYDYIKRGIIYDIWGMPVQPCTPQHHINAPILGINSEVFMYWGANFDIAKGVCEEAGEVGQPAWLVTVRGTVHIAQSDFCVLYPRLAGGVMKMTMDPVRAIDVNIDASLDFLDRTLHFDGEDDNHQAFRRNLPEKKFLDLDVEKGMPDEHKPDPKYTAVRLKVKHEGRKKLKPHARQRYWDNLREKGEEEVWVHMAPGKEVYPDGNDDEGAHQVEEQRPDEPQQIPAHSTQ
ncbi:hypothetical protein LTR70_002623 [Exophiala xenobiotica]|uniref:1-alkyl-2-acetylglycerophosphocholine esterase n=1 Tax=Lithohypha guttulata TaxID=1690604 RepID=A0ABR0KIL2_9EURO|nr:hypothetical protein LTR24_002200 [Lithohypha guttulata]KAK5325243.1 hypothetical protein LTR70_002623 [Exophiala xenobiotica]